MRSRARLGRCQRALILCSWLCETKQDRDHRSVDSGIHASHTVNNGIQKHNCRVLISVCSNSEPHCHITYVPSSLITDYLNSVTVPYAPSAPGRLIRIPPPTDATHRRHEPRSLRPLPAFRPHTRLPPTLCVPAIISSARRSAPSTHVAPSRGSRAVAVIGRPGKRFPPLTPLAVATLVRIATRSGVALWTPHVRPSSRRARVLVDDWRLLLRCVGGSKEWGLGGHERGPYAVFGGLGGGRVGIASSSPLVRRVGREVGW